MGGDPRRQAWGKEESKTGRWKAKDGASMGRKSVWVRGSVLLGTSGNQCRTHLRTVPSCDHSGHLSRILGPLVEGCPCKGAERCSRESTRPRAGRNLAPCPAETRERPGTGARLITAAREKTEFREVKTIY